MCRSSDRKQLNVSTSVWIQYQHTKPSDWSELFICMQKIRKSNSLQKINAGNSSWSVIQYQCELLRTGEFLHRGVWTVFVMHENITVCEELLVMNSLSTVTVTDIISHVCDEVNDNYTVVHCRVMTWLTCTVTTARLRHEPPITALIHTDWDKCPLCFHQLIHTSSYLWYVSTNILPSSTWQHPLHHRAAQDQR